MATIKSYLALEDRMSPTLSKAEKQAIANYKAFSNLEKSTQEIANAMKNLEESGLANTKMFNDLAEAGGKNIATMTELADGTKNVNASLNDQKNILPSIITSLIGWRAVLGGIRSLTNMSDIFTANTARLNMMNDGLQTTEELQEMIYKTAQDTRVSYKGMTDMVAKLGMQAGEVFGNNSKQIVAFTGLLNKLFTTAGMDATSIQSVMYNMTQSLSTGQLLGQDYRILKQNAPQMIKYLQDFYGVSRKELDNMVSKGQVTAQALKAAIFGAADDITKKFEEMPVTFEQAWTRFSNTIQKILTPVLNVLSIVIQYIDQFFTFLSENEYILWLVAAGVTAILAPILLYNTYTAIATIMTNLLSTSLGIAYLKFVLLTGAILLVVGFLIYLWNTNDDVAYAMLTAWDGFRLGIQKIKIDFIEAWYQMLNALTEFKIFGLQIIDSFINGAISMINFFINAVNKIPGVAIQTISYQSNLAANASQEYAVKKAERAADIASMRQNYANDWYEAQATREDRVKNRTKIGYNPATQNDSYLSDMLQNINSTIDPNGNGGSAMRTNNTNEVEIKDEDIQLMLDIATRDFKLQYQQITPNINVSFGDIHETADVDGILEQIVNEIDEVYQANLEVIPAT